METQNPQEDLLYDVKGTYDRLTEQELANLGITLGAYRSFRGDRRKHIAYVSMPITTGKRYYDVLSAAGAKDTQEFIAKAGKEALFTEIIKKNVEEGVKFADLCGERENLLFIAPSVFDAKAWKWTDDAYMALWYRVIGELAGSHVMMDGWEYSFGGAREAFFSLLMQWRVIREFTKDEAIETFGLKNFHPGLSHEQMAKEFEGMWKIRVYDSGKKEITLETALVKIVDAIEDLHTRGFDCTKLLNLAHCIGMISWKSPFFMAPEQAPCDVWNSKIFQNAKDRLFALNKSVSGN